MHVPTQKFKCSACLEINIELSSNEDINLDLASLRLICQPKCTFLFIAYYLSKYATKFGSMTEKFQFWDFEKWLFINTCFCIQSAAVVVSWLPVDVIQIC